MLFTPSYDGNPIFGVAVRMQMHPNLTANQVSEFFGIEGVFNLYGGSRGRVFTVEGCLVGIGEDMFDGVASLNSLEQVIHSYADGIGRVLIDTRGRVWGNVVFDDVFQPDPKGPQTMVGYSNLDGSPAWGLQYRAAFRGLL